MESLTDPRPIAGDLPKKAADGLRKAAVLLASLPPDDAAYLLRQLDEQQLVAVTAAAQNGPFRPSEQVTIQQELTVVHKRALEQSSGGHRSIRRLDRPPSPVAIAARDSRQAFAPLADAPAATMARLLADELPQTVAVVLANLAPALAAQILERMPTETQVATTLRIAEIRTPDPVAVTEIAKALSNRFDDLNSPPVCPIGGAAHIAQILKHTNRATEKALLANLGQESANLGKSVSRHLSVLRHLNANDVRTQTGRIPSRTATVGEVSSARKWSQCP